MVLHPLPSNLDGPDASLSDRGNAPQYRFQVTSIGATEEQAENVADRGRAALRSSVLTITGRTQVCLIVDLSTGPTVDEDVNPPVFYAVDRYRLDS
jgi:hypothetical protein